MSKMLEATCVGGVVTAEGVPVPAAEIMSEGVGLSDGVVILDQDKARYLANTTPDLKSTLDNLATALGQVVTALNSSAVAMTAIDAAAAAKLVVTAPVATVAIAQVVSAAVALTTIQTQLQTLKATLK